MLLPPLAHTLPSDRPDLRAVTKPLQCCYLAVISEGHNVTHHNPVPVFLSLPTSNPTLGHRGLHPGAYPDG
jgi:hypothetical protein